MVFNSNTYYSAEAAKLLDGVIDVYLKRFQIRQRPLRETVLTR